MKRSRSTAWWGAYGLGAAVVIGGLAWMSVRVIRLEREERVARLDAERQETTRLALWRIDSWLSPRLARESARTWFDYEPYHPQTIAYNRLLEPIAEGEVLLPSPLLNFSSVHFPLHFQWRRSTGFTSPQVPSAALLERGAIACSPVPARPDRAELLRSTVAAIDLRDMEQRLRDAERPIDLAFADNRAALLNSPEWNAQRSKSNRLPDAGDLKARQSASNYAQQAFESREQQTLAPANEGVASSAVDVGPLVPIWLGGDAPRLIIARRVRIAQETLVQGMLVDWPALRSELLKQVEDIAPNAELLQMTGDTADDATRLASLPVMLGLGGSSDAQIADLAAHPAALGLGLVWLAALGAIGMTGLALRASIGAAVRTSRFASSVTHELRTPLTTFRLYSEMLADGIVTDEAKKREYLGTLRDESARLGLLVENVLAWSRAEDGRAPAEPRRLSLRTLVDDVAPVLRRRCEEHGVAFAVAGDIDTNATVTTDPDRVRQILFNLVDNGCKYAGRGSEVRLRVEPNGTRTSLAIEDNGPGVPDRLRRRIFRAFDRGERGPGDSIRGLGLGLAISSELARGLGGRLRCETSTLGGAQFSLELPIDRAER